MDIITNLPRPLPRLQAMAHAAYVYDIRHVVIDNLQFMTGNIVR